DHRADDAEQDGEDNSARLLAGHEELGDCSRDQSEHDPQHDAHDEISRYEVSRSVPPFHVAGPTAPPLQIVHVERAALGADLSIARLLSRGGPFPSPAW